MSDFLFVDRHSIYSIDFTVINALNNVVDADDLPVASFRNYTDATGSTEIATRQFTATPAVGVYRLVLSSDETAAPGLYYVHITYNLNGVPQSYRVDIQISGSLADDVFAWIGTPAPKPEAMALMARVVEGVMARITQTYTVPEDNDPNFNLAVVMQSARIWQRKDSPGGVISNSEFGPFRVTRIDSDIAEMLDPYVAFHFA